MDRKEYNFQCGIKAYQEECNLRQDKELLQLIKEIDLGEVKDFRQLKLQDIIDKILSNDIVEKFFNIILIEKTDSAHGIDWTQLKRSEVIEVIEDFFQLSPALQEWFGTGKLGVDSLLGLNSKKESNPQQTS